jgi:hypothetical protein
VRHPPARLLCCALFVASLAPLFPQEKAENPTAEDVAAASAEMPATPEEEGSAAEPSSSAEALSPSAVDNLFTNPQADTEAQTSDAKQLLQPFRAQPLTVTGSFNSTLGAVVGYSDTENKDGTYDRANKLKVTPGLNFVPAMTFVARPDETIRFQGTLSFPFDSDDMFSPEINEMFFDYTWEDSIYLRIGKHLISWGVTRIFDAGGDLMEDSNEDLDVKATVPIGSGGVSAVLLMPPSFMSDNYSWRELVGGLQVNYPFGGTEFILSGTYYGNDEEDTPLRATAVMKTSLLGIDLFAEGIWASYADIKPEVSLKPIINGIVAGFYWDRSGMRLYGEYYFDATDTTGKSQFISTVAGVDHVFGSPFNLLVQWTHAFLDGSGIVIPGFSVKLLPHITLQVGLPCRYGDPESYYLVNESPRVQTAVVPTKTFNWYQRYGLLLRLTMNTNF